MASTICKKYMTQLLTIVNLNGKFHMHWCYSDSYRVWLSISKVIDTFHLRNHTRPECHTYYNPEKLKEAHPGYNTQACEQTFSWLGRYHKVLSSMPKVHNHFYLHRLVKRRNLYNSYCYKKGKKPLLPNVKMAKK